LLSHSIVAGLFRVGLSALGLLSSDLRVEILPVRFLALANSVRGSDLGADSTLCFLVCKGPGRGFTARSSAAFGFGTLLRAIVYVPTWVTYKRDNYSGAIPLLEFCVKKIPDFAQYHYHLGLALIAAGQKDTGRAQLQASLQMSKLRPAEQENAQQTLAQNN